MTDVTDLPAVLSALAGLPAGAAADAARADQDARWRAGQGPPAEAYLAALPAVAADPEQALVLIYGEVLTRAARGEAPTLDEYRARFPHLADRLAVQFAVHDALAAGPSEAVAGQATARATDPGPGEGRPMPLPGRVGEYEILGELGRGGMGLVLAARDPTLDREVAVKVLLPGLPAGPGAARRFVREARITARLPHPAVPPVHALGERPDGTPYLAMKLVRGQTLDALLRGRPDPGSDAARFVGVFAQVCQAVGFAHAQGVVHRDLKPANVMVGSFGEV